METDFKISKMKDLKIIMKILRKRNKIRTFTYRKKKQNTWKEKWSKSSSNNY